LSFSAAENENEKAAIAATGNHPARRLGFGLLVLVVGVLLAGIVTALVA